MSQTLTSPNSAGERNARPARLGFKLTSDSTLSFTNPPWIRSVVDRIDYLLGLPQDWDDEGGKPLEFETAMCVLNFLLQRAYHDTPAPQLIPTGSGGLQVEWHTGGRDLEILFEPNQATTFYYLAEDGTEREGDVAHREDAISAMMRNLPAREERTLFER